jgi:hypothetical protein
VPGVTEIQAGSYALMDTDYGDVGVPFEQAFFVLGTIVSRPSADRCVADAGHKSTTKDHGLPRVHGLDGATVTSLNDEHATIAIPPARHPDRRSRAPRPVAHRPDDEPPRRDLRRRRGARRRRVADRGARLRRRVEDRRQLRHSASARSGRPRAGLDRPKSVGYLICV